MSKFLWDDETQAALVAIVGTDTDVTVSKEVIEQAVAEIEGAEVRNITGKLRNMGYTCVSMAKVGKGATFTEAEGDALAVFVEANKGVYTFAEIAANFAEGQFTTREVQGKLLSMELSGTAKPTEKAEVHKQYTDEQEGDFIDMANNGHSIEDIAKAMGKPVNSARGKALSLLRKGEIQAIPFTRDKTEKAVVDLFGDLDTDSMTLAEIVSATSKTERGVKTTLTRRGFDCVDYKGSVRKAKLEAKAAKDLEEAV